MGTALAVFFGVLLLIFFLGSLTRGRVQTPMARLVMLGPAVLLLIAGLVVPAVLTTIASFKDANNKKFIGLQHFSWVFTNPDNLVTLRNTVLWVVITPLVSTGLGLLLAVLIDRMKRESIPKSLIFMPLAISSAPASSGDWYINTASLAPNRLDS